MELPQPQVAVVAVVDVAVVELPQVAVVAVVDVDVPAVNKRQSAIRGPQKGPHFYLSAYEKEGVIIFGWFRLYIVGMGSKARYTIVCKHAHGLL